jgi:hypothetical protein
MAYPRKPRQEDTGAEDRATHPVPPVVPGHEIPQVTRPQGGAPKTETTSPLRDATPVFFGPVTAPEPMLYGWRRWKGIGLAPGQIPPGGEFPTAAPWSIEEMNEMFPRVTEYIKEAMDRRFAEIPEEERSSSMFWRGYQTYPMQMAQLIVRRLLMNSLTAQGEVADWMAWLESRRAQRRGPNG